MDLTINSLVLESDKSFHIACVASCQACDFRGWSSHRDDGCHFCVRNREFTHESAVCEAFVPARFPLPGAGFIKPEFDLYL
jgi:hypothetical protein